MRRMKNCAIHLPLETRARHVSQAMEKMKRSGYDEATRKEVVLAGLRAYYRKVDREEGGGGRVNRSKWEGAARRRVKKLVGKASWFKTSPTATNNTAPAPPDPAATAARGPGGPGAAALGATPTADRPPRNPAHARGPWCGPPNMKRYYLYRSPRGGP